MRPAHRSLVVLAVVSAFFAALAALPGLRAADPRPPSLEVRATSIELPPGDPAHGRLGALAFRSGLVLESADPRFGGLSDLRLREDGRRLLAVSDCGYGFSADLLYDAAGGLAGIESPRLVDLTGPGGRPLRAGEHDAESLLADGASLGVGFEGRGRVWRYGADPPFSPPVEVAKAPSGLARCGANAGLETIARSSGVLLLVCEGERTPSLTTPAWTGVDGAWTERRYPLHFEGGWGGEPFRPTGATTLADGDVLVLERRFPPFGSRVVRVPRAGLEGAFPLAPVEIANLEGSFLVDNYEGIEARRDASGRTLVYLLADDNSCAKPGGIRASLGRTRLLMFELVGPQPASAIGS
jgi:hypothetical protein